MSKSPDSPITRLLRWIHWCEDSLLVFMLLTMILIAFAQIILRNFFDGGIVWGDSLVRVLVIWVALAGAMVAGRKNAHISIDLLSPWLHGGFLRFTRSISALFTAVVCGIMLYYSLEFVESERLDGSIAFAGISTWVCESIIPIAFAVLTLRFTLSFFLALTQTAVSNNPSDNDLTESNRA